MVDLREKQAWSALGWSWAHQGEIQYDVHGSGAFMIIGLVFIFLLLNIFNLYVQVEEIVRIAGERGILSILDMHQDVFNRF